MLLSPYLCGRWDGCHLWAQWSPVAGATYLFEWRWRTVGPLSGLREWSAWQKVRRAGGLRRAWLALPIWRDGAEIQARVAVLAGEPQWELAQEVTFLRNRCRFRITAERRDLLLMKGAEWHRVVDGAAVSYVLTEDAAVLKGEAVEVWAESLGLGGFAQLDHPGHFRITPELGLVIENTAPSESDIAPTGRDFATLASLPAAPPRLVFQSSVR